MIDVYIDEDKVNGYLGFLVVKNTPYIQQILFNKRQKFQVYHELHFKATNNMAINLYKSWINLFLNFEEIYELENKFCYFDREAWDAKLWNKKEVICNFLRKLSSDENTSDIVVFMDFDTEHKNNNLENLLYKDLNVLRVFHMNSKAVDLLQLVDVLLWSSLRWTNAELGDDNYSKVEKKILSWKNCTKWELKWFLWTYILKHDKNNKITKK